MPELDWNAILAPIVSDPARAVLFLGLLLSVMVCRKLYGDARAAERGRLEDRKESEAIMRQILEGNTVALTRFATIMEQWRK